jgi:predicted nucleotidyltransferase
VLLLQHGGTSTPIEVSLAWLPFEHEALARAERLDLAGGSVPIATAEDLVVYKAVAARAEDWSDVERLLELHGAHFDLGRIRGLVAEFAAALEEPERAAKLEELLRRTTGA